MLRLAGKSNGAFRNGKTSWVWTSTPVEVPCLRVNNKSKLDRHLLELVVRLCTRFGMIMEGVSVVALTSTADGMPLRSS